MHRSVNITYQTARYHNQESAEPLRHSRDKFISSKIWIQFCRCWWQSGLSFSSAAERLRHLNVAGGGLCNELITISGEDNWMRD
jgi:hypothetical protein